MLFAVGAEGMTEALAAAQRLVDAARSLVEAATENLARLTNGGEDIDEHQVNSERLAQWATQTQAAVALLDYARSAAEGGAPDRLAEDEALAYAAETAHGLLGGVQAAPELFAGREEQVSRLAHEAGPWLRLGLAEKHLRSIGERVIETRAVNNVPLGDAAAELLRSSARAFARDEIGPIAQEIHRPDLLIPDNLIAKMADLGFFGGSVPEEYGGSAMGHLTMVVLAEELSAVSLAAGSLVTRSEILTRALLEAGTEEQKRKWLPRLASGELMVGICVTEPDVGSDVASLQCRATPGELNGWKGWFIDGAKAWSTFAGRANVLAVLARTDPDLSKGFRGLSLFIVEKDPFPGHTFVQTQPGGGSITGTANPTPGYRGMHSFTLAFDRYFVPEENVVGGEAGLGRGFYMQMAGFAVSRLQTAGRAIGVAQAALEKACHYTVQRVQFGRPIAEYQLTQYTVGRMATHVSAARQLTYAAARHMDEAQSARLEPGRAVWPAIAKLHTADVAVWVSQEAQLLHGGWGYSDEDPIARYVADAQVLPIFEGVKPILELKIIARQLLTPTTTPSPRT